MKRNKCEAQDMPKYNLTDKEKTAHLRFKAAWDAWRKEEKGRTQQWIAEQLGITHASFSAYLIGRTPLNLNILLKASTIMRRNPRDIYPELFDGIDISLALLPSESDADLLEIMEILGKLPIEKRRLIKSLLQEMI